MGTFGTHKHIVCNYANVVACCLALAVLGEAEYGSLNHST